jgi:hypothetical protein
MWGTRRSSSPSLSTRLAALGTGGKTSVTNFCTYMCHELLRRLVLVVRHASHMRARKHDIKLRLLVTERIAHISDARDPLALRGRERHPDRRV